MDLGGSGIGDVSPGRVGSPPTLEELPRGFGPEMQGEEGAMGTEMGDLCSDMLGRLSM